MGTPPLHSDPIYRMYVAYTCIICIYIFISACVYYATNYGLILGPVVDSVEQCQECAIQIGVRVVLSKTLVLVVDYNWEVFHVVW